MLPDAPPFHDRRQIQREPGNSCTRLDSWSLSGGNLDALLQDISIQGVGIITDRFLAAGTPLQLPDRGVADNTEILLTEVKHSTKQPDGRWLVGCAFSRLLTAEDALRLF